MPVLDLFVLVCAYVCAGCFLFVFLFSNDEI